MEIANLTNIQTDPPYSELLELAQNWPLCFMLDLGPDYVAWVAGAYQGKVMQLLAELWPDYGEIVGWEPQRWAAEKAFERVASYPRMRVEMNALGCENATQKMGEWGTDACSFVNTGPQARQHGEGTMLEIGSMLEINKPVDLFVMNMEGYEFDLLDHMIRQKLLTRFDRLAIQWHLFPNSNNGIRRDVGAMNDKIAELEYHGFDCRVDLRPAWSFHVKH